MYKKSLFIICIMGMAALHGKSIWERDPLEVRDQINQKIMAIEAEKLEVESVLDLEIALETPIRIYRPSKASDLPVILMIHGGAWVAGNLDTHDNLARYLSSQANAVVVSVGYLNSPEGKFPLPLEQCYEALQWTRQNLAPAKLIVLGDSAGGNLAAALCLLARDRGGPKIDAQVLINPATDLYSDSFDFHRWQAKQYLQEGEEASNGYVSPLAAKDLSSLPPALVILAEYDQLREMGQKYADRLSEAGVATTVYCQSGIDHLAGNGARASDLAKPSLEVAINWIKEDMINESR